MVNLDAFWKVIPLLIQVTLKRWELKRNQFLNICLKRTHINFCLFGLKIVQFKISIPILFNGKSRVVWNNSTHQINKCYKVYEVDNPTKVWTRPKYTIKRQYSTTRFLVSDAPFLCVDKTALFVFVVIIFKVNRRTWESHQMVAAAPQSVAEIGSCVSTFNYFRC